MPRTLDPPTALRRLALYEAALPARSFWFARHGDATPAIAAIGRWEDELRDRCNGAISSYQTIAVLLGPTGTGKTTASCWWAWNHTFAGYPDNDESVPMFVTAAAFARAGRKERKRLLAADELILDDLGAEQTDAGVVPAVDELVDSFYSRQYVTLIITTNATPAQLRARYGARIADRLREVATLVPLTGASLRRPARLEVAA